MAQRLSLELNAESISAAVDIYIEHKVNKLAKDKNYSGTTKRRVSRYLSTHATGTFLWVALVCEELKDVPELYAEKSIKTFPRELDALYQRIMQQVGDSNPDKICHQFLALTALAYRPLSLLESTSFFEELDNLSRDTESDDSEWEDSHSADTN